MVTVAKKIDAPIKLLFPYWLDGEMKFSMLGLGDIVIPGIFIALCVRYDINKGLNQHKNKIFTIEEIEKIPTPYFNWCMLSYALGIFMTFAIMILADSA